MTPAIVFLLALAVGSAARGAAAPLTSLWLLATAAVLIAAELGAGRS